MTEYDRIMAEKEKKFEEDERAEEEYQNKQEFKGYRQFMFYMGKVFKIMFWSTTGLFAYHLLR